MSLGITIRNRVFLVWIALTGKRGVVALAAVGGKTAQSMCSSPRSLGR